MGYTVYSLQYSTLTWRLPRTQCNTAYNIKCLRFPFHNYFLQKSKHTWWKKTHSRCSYSLFWTTGTLFWRLVVTSTILRSNTFEKRLPRYAVVWCGVVCCAVLQICMKRQLNFNRKTLTCAFPSPTCSTTVAKMPYVMNDCQIVFMLIQIRYPLLKCYTVVELVGVWEIHWRVWCVSTMIYRHFQSSMHTFRFSCDLRCTS